MTEGPYREPPPPPPPPQFAAEQRNVVVAFILNVVTLGVYEIVWYWRRRAFLDSLDVRSTIGPIMLGGATLLSVASFLFNPERTHVEWPFLVIGGDFVMRFVLAFRARAALNEWAVRERMPGPRSALWTWFWRFLYLQHRMNRTAERERELARLGRKSGSPRP